MKESTAKNSKLIARERTAIIKQTAIQGSEETSPSGDENLPINRLRSKILSNVEHATEETPDAAYRYAAFSWRGINDNANRTVVIYESGAYGILVCLWREYSDENNKLTGRGPTGSAIALFSNSNDLETVRVINEWMNGTAISKIREYIKARPDAFVDPYLTDDEI